MVLDLIFNIIVAIGVIIGLFGGIPKIREMIKPKPCFKVIKNRFVKYTKGESSDIFIRIKNNGKAIATNVGFRWAIIKRDTDLIIDDSAEELEIVGLLAPDTSKEQIATAWHWALESFNEYDLWIRIECEEGYHSEERIPLTIEETDKTPDEVRCLVG